MDMRTESGHIRDMIMGGNSERRLGSVYGWPRNRRPSRFMYTNKRYDGANDWWCGKLPADEAGKWWFDCEPMISNDLLLTYILYKQQKLKKWNNIRNRNGKGIWILKETSGKYIVRNNEQRNNRMSKKTERRIRYILTSDFSVSRFLSKENFQF